MAANMLRQSVRRLTTDGYLHKTNIPTMHFQDSLLKLAIPKLEDTLKRYVSSASPLVSAEELANTKKLVEEFGKGVGVELDLELRKKNREKYSSYISEPWFDMYLKDRRPLPINTNPQMTFLNDPGKTNQVQRATSFLVAAARYYRTVRDGHLKPEIFHTKPQRSQTSRYEKAVTLVPKKAATIVSMLFGAYPLDMSQYDRLFHSTRIPQVGKDALQSFAESEGRHVIVQRGADFWTVPVLRTDGSAVPADEIAGALSAILAAPKSTSPALGLLTATDRDTWARERATLIADPVNAKSLRAIDSALFAMSLEDTTPHGLVEEQRFFLHGDGRARWFDKSFQLIVAPNGRTAINFEHAWGDGVAVLRFFNETHADAVAQPLATPRTPAAAPQLLQWNFAPSTAAAVSKAAAEFDAQAKAVHALILQTDMVDTNVLRELQVGADGFLQMSFQLAHYRLMGKNGSTYESASTAGFKHGRTETIRSATPQSDAMCKAYARGAADSERAALTKAAIINHAKLSKEALFGKGWDRHLFALRVLAEQRGAVPAIYTDSTYKTLSNIILSTSTLSSPALDGGGFGPVGPDCIGIGYGIRDYGGRFTLMSQRRDLGDFMECLHSSLRDMRATLEQGRKSA